MDLIVAVTSDWGIGNSGKLLFSIPDDMRFFREKTKDAVVVMGRSTLDSFPDGKPLRGRTNIVFTRSAKYENESVLIVRSLDEALRTVTQYSDKPVFVIGGGQIYSLLLPYCEMAFVTKMDIILPADTRFPDLDSMENWIVTDAGKQLYYGDVGYRFIVYKNTSVKSVNI